MRRVLFSFSFALIPFFSGICLPYVRFPGDVRLANLLWGVVYGAGFFAIDWFGAFHPAHVSSAIWFALIAWPVAVSAALVMIGSRLHRTNRSRVRLLSICIL